MLLAIIHVHAAICDCYLAEKSLLYFHPILSQRLWTISSTLFGICLCISGTDEQDHKPRYK